jgi:hypothetical protein
VKAPFKPGNGRRRLAIISHLALAVCLLDVWPAAAQGAPATNTNAVSSDASPTDYNNWITLGAGGMLTSGDKAQAEHQRQIPDGAFGGVEDFHWQQFVGKKGLFQVDGHGIFDNHDYSIRLELSDPDKGYIRGGYTEFRTWYDGNGGFFPQNNQWFSLNNNELHVDRGDAWFEAGLTLPDKPIITFRYDHESRQGDKDSTSWGDITTVTASDRKIVPTFLGIDETRDIFQVNIKDTLGNTDVGLGLRYEIDRDNDSTYIDLDPANANRFVTQNNVEQDTLFNIHGFTETFLNKKITFSLGGSFTTIDTDLSGSRIYGPTYNAPLSTTYVNNGSGFTGLGGGGNTKEYVANMNLMLTPIDNLVFVPALRVEYEGSDLSDNSDSTSGTGATFKSIPTDSGSDNWSLDVAESLEARYTGFRNWSLYTSGEWSEDSGNEFWNQETNAVFKPILNQDWTRLGQKYTVGANWYPLYRLNFGAQYYHQTQDYDYDNNLTATPTTYPGYLAYQKFKTDDMNIRATWRPFSTLSLVTRYDFQLSTVDTTGGSLNSVQSAEITSHIISQSVNWTPFSRLYVQVSGSYVLDSVDTPPISITGVTNFVLPGKNDYWTVSAMSGFALDNKTDLQLQYTYYRADDYVNTSVTQPYGAGDEEQSVTATITRQITKAIKVSLKYGFFRNRDQTSGGNNNYDAHLVYASMQYRF